MFSFLIHIKLVAPTTTNTTTTTKQNQSYRSHRVKYMNFYSTVFFSSSLFIRVIIRESFMLFSTLASSIFVACNRKINKIQAKRKKLLFSWSDVKHCLLFYFFFLCKENFDCGAYITLIVELKRLSIPFV